MVHKDWRNNLKFSESISPNKKNAKPKQEKSNDNQNYRHNNTKENPKERHDVFSL